MRLNDEISKKILNISSFLPEVVGSLATSTLNPKGQPDEAVFYKRKKYLLLQSS